MKIIDLKKASVDEIVDTLNDAGLVIMPTETLYGAFVDATNPKAVERLTKFKARPFGKPYSIAVNNIQMAQKYVELNNNARNLYKNFLPGPLTVVSKGKHTVAPGVESETGTLGIRIPDFPFILDVIKKINKPLTATSANASYKKRPYSMEDILTNLSAKQKSLIGLVIDAGTLPRREPSTVIDTTLEELAILRQGDIKLKDKNEVLSKSPEQTQNIAKELWQRYEEYIGKRAIVFALEGEMGAGKTIFTKGLALALDIKDQISSPTYDLEHIYKIKKSLHLNHIDAWRIESGSELLNLGFDNNIHDKSVIVIEWADRVTDEIRKYNEDAIIIWVKIKYGKGEDSRFIEWGVL